MLEREQKLSTVEPATLFVEPLLALEMVEELSAIHKAVGLVNTDDLPRADNASLTRGQGTISARTGS